MFSRTIGNWAFNDRIDGPIRGLEDHFGKNLQEALAAPMIPASWDWQKKAKILQVCLQSFCFTLPQIAAILPSTLPATSYSLPATLRSTHSPLFLFSRFLRFFVANPSRHSSPSLSLSPVTPESRSAQVKGPLVSPFQLSGLSDFRFCFTLHTPLIAHRSVRLSPFAFLLLFSDIGSILNHPERYEKHHTRH
jgi:hypothetical protein